MTHNASFIIIGPPRTGKTILAKRLSSHVGASHLHADSLVSAFESVFPHLGITHDAPTLDSICDAFEPWVFSLIRNLLTCECRFVLDSYHIRLASLLQQVDIMEHLTIIPVGYPFIQKHTKLAMIRTFSDKHDWMRKLTDHDALEFIERSIKRSISLKIESEIAGIPFLDLSEDFEGRITRFLENHR